MGPSRLSPPYFARIRLLAAAMMVIIGGLCLRAFGYEVGLPFVAVKYGGSELWGAMVYLLLAAILPSRWYGYEVHIAVVVVELIRLVHFPALDAFRATAAGALLLGRVFSVWNIVCYIGGIAVASFTSGRGLRALPSSPP